MSNDHEMEQLTRLMVKIAQWYVWHQYERAADEIERITGQHISNIWIDDRKRIVDFYVNNLDKRFDYSFMMQYLAAGWHNVVPGGVRWQRGSKPEKPIVAIQTLDDRQDEMTSIIDELKNQLNNLEKVINNE